MGETESKNESQSYFVQVGDKVKGPFSIAQLRVLRDRGSLGSFHRISSDKVNWKQAKDLDGLFAKKNPSRKVASTNETTLSKNTEADQTIKVEQLPDSKNQDGGWYYLDSKERARGPISESVIEGMCGDGRLALDSMIWSSELSAWTEVARTRFARFCAATKSASRDSHSTEVKSGKFELSSPGQRLGASLLDALLYMLVLALGWCIAFFLSVTFILGVSNDSDADNPGIVAVAVLIQLFITASFWLVFLVIQSILISTSGQTIGKKLVGIRIVNIENNTHPGFGKGVLLRSFLPGVIYGIPVIGLIFLLVDLCYIFREDHRCVHDHMAGTRVIKV